MSFIGHLRAGFGWLFRGRGNGLQEGALPARRNESEEFRRIRAAHLRLGRGIYWRGGLASWYRLWGKEPRRRKTLADQAALLGKRERDQVARNAVTYAGLPWWKKLFSVKRRDYNLFLYLGGRRYLSANCRSNPIGDAFRRLFLPLLQRSRYGEHWYLPFSRGDERRLANWRQRQVSEGLLQQAKSLKQQLQKAKAEIEEVEVRVKKARAWAEVSEYSVAAAKDGDRSLKSRILVTAQDLGKESMRCGAEAIHTGLRVLAVVRDVRKQRLPLATGHPGLGALKKEVEELASEVVSISKKTMDVGELAKSQGYRVAWWAGEVAHARAKAMGEAAEAMRGEAEAMRGEAEAMRGEAEAATLRARETRRLLNEARQAAVGQLEQRSLELDRREREIRGMTKLQRLREPSAWTEADIFLMRIAILREAIDRRVYHLLPASPVFSSIFNTQRRTDGSHKEPTTKSEGPRRRN